MAAEDRYRVDEATNSDENLKKVLQFVATLPGHVRVINVIWQPDSTNGRGEHVFAHYTIISEMEV